MSDPKKGVPIQLDRERYLRFTARDARELYGSGSDDSKDGLEQLIHVLYIGLRHDDPILTEDELWDIVDMHEVTMYREKLSEAMGSKPSGIKDEVTIPLASSDQT